MMDNLIIRAAHFAENAHGSQQRKWSDEPYIMHCGRVAARVTLLATANPEMVAAAWLHDTIEDCKHVNADLLSTLFGASLTSLIVELTNPSKQHPKLPRAERKAMDREHLAGVSDAAKFIKLIDRADNVRSIGNAPTDFIELYLAESELLADVLRDASYELHRELIDAIHHFAPATVIFDPSPTTTAFTSYGA